MAQSPSDWKGKTLANGRYLVRAKLGEGGMGYVFRAHDRNLEADVVIKVPRRAMLEDPEFASRFSREIRSLVKLAHPCIVKITDVGEHDGVPFAVMQYLSGGSLEDYRPTGAASEKGQARANAAELGDWLTGVADALDFVHSQGYVHRDVKPGNILFDAHGHVFLSDFGVAKALGTTQGVARGQTAHTGTGMVLGTPEYMAPELVMGRPFDGRIDQYALAVTVFEMLCGRRPFDAPTPTAILVMQTTDEAPSLCVLDCKIPRALSDAVGRALSKNPANRYPTCKAFAEAATASAATSVGPAPTSPSGGNAVRADQVRLACPECHKNLILPARLFENLDKVRGKKFTCPSCQAQLMVADDGRSLVTAGPMTSAVTPPAPSQTLPSLSASTPPPSSQTRQRVAATMVQEAPRAQTVLERVPEIAQQEGLVEETGSPIAATPIWVWAAAGSAAICALVASVAAAFILMPSVAPTKEVVIPRDGQVRIDVSGVPKDAMITLDRVQKDAGDLKVPQTLRAGEHELAVSSAGFQSYRKSFVVDPAKPADVRVTLAPVPAPKPAVDLTVAPRGRPEPGSTPPPPPTAVPPPALRNPTLARRTNISRYEPVPDGPSQDVDYPALSGNPAKYANKIVVASGLFMIVSTGPRHFDGTASLDVERVRFQFENLKRPRVVVREHKPHTIVADANLVREIDSLRTGGSASRNDNAVVLTFHVAKRVDGNNESWEPVLKKVEIVTFVSPVLIGEQKFRGAVKTLVVTPTGTHQGGNERTDWREHLGAPYVGALKRVVHELKKAAL